jgi:hypothetical protein
MKKLHRELNIVNIIRQLRFLQGAVNFLTTRHQRRWIYMQARYNVIQDYVRQKCSSIQVDFDEMQRAVEIHNE